MRPRSLLVLIILGAFFASQAGYALAGGMGSAHGKNEMQPAEKSTEIEAPLLAPTDYVEWLESHEGIETGTLTAPGVEPTVIRGPDEFVEVPEGG